MSHDDADPQPGDFDVLVESLGPQDLRHVEADRTRRLLLQVAVSVEDAERLQHLADQRGAEPSDVLSSLIRSA